MRSKLLTTPTRHAEEIQERIGAKIFSAFLRKRGTLQLPVACTPVMMNFPYLGSAFARKKSAPIRAFEDWKFR